MYVMMIGIPATVGMDQAESKRPDELLYIFATDSLSLVTRFSVPPKRQNHYPEPFKIISVVTIEICSISGADQVGVCSCFEISDISSPLLMGGVRKPQHTR